MVKICLTCKKSFTVYPYEFDRRKHCSKKCHAIHSFGENGFWLGKKRNNLKLTNAVKTMFKSTGLTFKGTKTQYHTLHGRVRRKLGKAKMCTFCGTNEGIIDWANKSGKYLMDTRDWIALCRHCHWHYDKEGGGVYATN